MSEPANRPDTRLDRPSESVALATDIDWAAGPQRGRLSLQRDGAQHRRYHALFEDLLN